MFYWKECNDQDTVTKQCSKKVEDSEREEYLRATQSKGTCGSEDAARNCGLLENLYWGMFNNISI